MALQKGFLRDPEVHFDKWLIASGVLLFLLFSGLFYSFFTYIREGFRVFEFEFNGSLIELNKSDIRFYNTFYASLSSVIGMNLGTRLVFQNIGRPRNTKIRLSQRNILHNQEFTLWMFLYCIGKSFSLLAIIYVSFQIQFEINFRKELFHFLVLIPIVWFLNSQLGLYRILRGEIQQVAVVLNDIHFGKYNDTQRD